MEPTYCKRKQDPSCDGCKLKYYITETHSEDSEYCSVSSFFCELGYWEE